MTESSLSVIMGPLFGALGVAVGVLAFYVGWKLRVRRDLPRANRVLLWFVLVGCVAVAVFALGQMVTRVF